MSNTNAGDAAEAIKVFRWDNRRGGGVAGGGQRVGRVGDLAGERDGFGSPEREIAAALPVGQRDSFGQHGDNRGTCDIIAGQVEGLIPKLMKLNRCAAGFLADPRDGAEPVGEGDARHAAAGAYRR